MVSLSPRPAAAGHAVTMGCAIVFAALGALVASSGCTGMIGDSPPPPDDTVIEKPADTGPPSTASCASTQLLAPRLVRLASSELRDLVRTALPGVDPMLLQSIAVQADHVAPISERIISNADFAAYREAAFSVANAYASRSTEAEPCRTGTPDACLHQVVDVAMTKLFRRVPSAEESAQASSTFQSLAASQGPTSAAAGVIAGALLSPQTVFHIERVGAAAGGMGKVDRATAVETAAFAMIGRAPSTEEARALSALSDDQFAPALAQQVATWSAASEFRERGLDFSEERFGVQHMPELSRSDPLFTPDLKAALSGEFREYVGQFFFSPDGSFADLFNKNPSRVFPGLEALYDRGSSGRRRGILGLASLLAARAAPDASSPVKRGIMVRVDLLCETVPPPIAGASFDKVMVTPDMQTRERYEALASITLCKSCHQTINPPGYLFEEFDQLGRHRDTEKGRPINAKGTLPAPFGGGPYSGVGDWDGIVPLADWMATSPEARTCFAAHFASYLLAEAIPDGAANCLLPSVAARFLKSGRIDELSADVVSSQLFLQRSQGAL